jgi:signal transduction histidine kinase
VVDLQLALTGETVRVPDEKAAHLLAIARESLSNVVKHAEATRASVELAVGDDGVRMTIRDNGRGFDTGRARSGAQHGVTNMASRAHASGGSLTVRSEIGVGTNIEIEIPLSEDK